MKNMKLHLLTGILIGAYTCSAFAANSTPQGVSSSPASLITKADIPQVVTGLYSDANGYLDIAQAFILINSGSSSTSNCPYAYYDNKANKLYLMSDAGSWQGGYAPGSVATIENSSVVLNCLKTVISVAGTTITINWNFRFKERFSGRQYVYLAANDRASAYSGWRVCSNVIIDSVAPTGSFTINSNAKYSNQLTVTLRLSLTDSSSGLDTMQFSNDGLTWTMAEPYATTKNWKLNSGDGQKIVYVKVSDKAGNASTAIAKSILLDMTPPNIVITSPIDRSFVNTPNKSVQYTCDGTAKSRVVMLTEGINTVTIQDNDAAGNVGSASIQVTLDTVPPEGSINVNNGALYTSQTQVTLALTAVDSSAGMDKMRFSTNNVSWSAPESYASTKTYTLPIGDGVKNIYVKYSDKAGNWSAVYSASITLFTGILIDQVKGGEVVSPDGKAKLIIPPGALWTTTRICIMTADPSLLQGSAPQHYLLQTLVDCKPSGLIFRKPCELDVELGQAEVPGTPIELGLLDETTQKIVFMEESTSVGSDGTSMKFPITHFSTYAGLASSLSQGAPIGAGVQVPLPDMLTGAFGHSLSLSVPPGRKGLQPSVNLQYKSSNTNSFVGVGWSLTPGYITRSTKLGPASYDDIKDTFVFVTDSGAAELTHLIDSLYQAKIESSFARFYKEEDSWRVVQKDGAVLRFGDTVDSKEISDRGTFLWNLTKVSDTNSNYMELTYGKDGGKSYLDRIDYTGNDATGTEPLNSIEFILEGRTDVSSNFSNGSEISIAKRLAEIRVKCQDRLVWRYLLTYEYSPGSSRSLLKTVTQFSSNRKAFPPQTFSYQKPHD